MLEKQIINLGSELYGKSSQRKDIGERKEICFVHYYKQGLRGVSL